MSGGFNRKWKLGGQMNSSFMKRNRSIAAGRKTTSHHLVGSLSFNILKGLKVSLVTKKLKIYNLDSYN